MVSSRMNKSKYAHTSAKIQFLCAVYLHLDIVRCKFNCSSANLTCSTCRNNSLWAYLQLNIKQSPAFPLVIFYPNLILILQYNSAFTIALPCSYFRIFMFTVFRLPILVNTSFLIPPKYFSMKSLQNTTYNTSFKNLAV